MIARARAFAGAWIKATNAIMLCTPPKSAIGSGGSFMDSRQDDLATLRVENGQLRRAVRELSTLNDLSRAIGASMHSEEVLQTIISRSLKAVNAEEGVVTLLERGRSGIDASRIYANTLVRANGNGGRS